MTDAHEAVIRAVMEDFCDEPWFDAETLNILARGNLGFNPDITPAVFAVRLGRQLACVQRLREAEAEAFERTISDANESGTACSARKRIRRPAAPPQR